MRIPLRLLPEGPKPGEAQPGDMWEAPAKPGVFHIAMPFNDPAKGVLFVWRTNARAQDGLTWDVTGEAPTITVSPSIATGEHPDGENGFHGWIRGGFIVR